MPPILFVLISVRIELPLYRTYGQVVIDIDNIFFLLLYTLDGSWTRE